MIKNLLLFFKNNFILFFRKTMSDSDDQSHLPNKKNKNLKSSRKRDKKNSLGEKEEDQNDHRNKKVDDEVSSADKFNKAKLRNPKAFALQSFVAAERQFRRLIFVVFFKYRKTRI